MLIPDIIKHAAFLFGVTPEDIIEDRRSALFCRARFALYAGLHLRLQRRGIRRIYVPVGKWLQRHHSSVLVGVRRAHAMMAADPEYARLVHSIADVTIETACKPRLQVLPGEASAATITERNTMDHPEYVEEHANKLLAARGTGLRIYWDGEIVSSDTPAKFNVYLGDDETDTVVYDTARSLLIAPSGDGPWAGDPVRTYGDLAEELTRLLGTGYISTINSKEAA